MANHELALVHGREIPVADRCTLELFAKPKGDFLWRLDKKCILKHVENGGSIEELKNFLNNKTDGVIPETVNVFLRDIEKKLCAIKGRCNAVLIELDDETTASLIAHDSTAKKYCYLTGNRFLTVPKNKERAFRSAIKKMGYVLSQ